jgi:hypothetical protein
MFTQGRFASTIVIAAMVICTTAAQAADNTRYVSITGNNANACTLAAPCRTLQKAIGVTPVGGEIQILESGFYGVNATIKKSLTVTGNGHTVYLGNPITIDQAGVVVALRGLVLDGQGAVADGISIVAADTVHIERCVVHRFTLRGIFASAPAGVTVFVIDSVSRDNGNAGFNIANAGAASRVTIDNSHFHNNGNGIGINSGHATISRSTISGNSSFGIVMLADGALTVESSVILGNQTGLRVDEGTARISNSTFTGNNLGIGVFVAGVVETRQNNTVRGNTLNTAGTALTQIDGV